MSHTKAITIDPEGSGNHLWICCRRSCGETTPSLQHFPYWVASGGDCVPSILALVWHWRLGEGGSAWCSMCSHTHNWHITEKSSNRRRCC